MRITVLYSIYDRYNLTICLEKRSTISVNKINIRDRAKSMHHSDSYYLSACASHVEILEARYACMQGTCIINECFLVPKGVERFSTSQLKHVPNWS